ncbi:MAG: 6-bladed beta-propeller [bacterium]
MPEYDREDISSSWPYKLPKFGINGSSLTSVSKWGSKGSEEAQFQWPEGIAVDEDNYVYVVDTGNCRVKKFDNNGNFITSWGSFGTETGQFSSSPRWIAVDNGPHNDVYITDINGNVYIFHNNGSFLIKWNTKASDESSANIAGIALDANSDIYVTDLTNYRVKKFSRNGTLLSRWGSEGAGDSQFNLPAGIALDSLGNIFVADLRLDRIQKFDNSGNFITKWGVSLESERYSTPMGIATDKNDNVWVADFDAPCIKKFSGDGDLMLKWGHYAMVGSDDDLYFHMPIGIAVDNDGNVYLTEDQEHRVQKFKE